MAKSSRVGWILIILLLIPTAGRISAADNIRLDDGAVKRLEGLCRLWGEVKFCHPYLATRDIDWDKALVAVLPAVRDAQNKEEFKAALEDLLSFLKDRATYIDERRPTNTESPNPNEAAGKQPEDHPFVTMTDDGIAVVSATDYHQFDGNTKPWRAMYMGFMNAFQKAAQSEKVILDFRNLTQGPPSWLLGLTISRTFGMLLKNSLSLPPSRFLHHRGYMSQKESSSAYYSELAVRSGGRVPVMSSPDIKAEKFVVLINSGSGNFLPLWTAMQGQGIAVVLHEGEMSRNAGSAVRRVELPLDLTAVIRTSEMLRADGGTGFRPDLIVEEKALETGLEILRGKREVKRPAAAEIHRPQSSRLFSTAENSYREMKYPEWNYRMLSLFRFWNVVNFFFPYKDLMDRSLDDIIGEFIPRFSKTADEREYVLAVAELSTLLQDSHVTMSNPMINKIRGFHGPPLRVDFVQGNTVVTMIHDPEIKKMGLAEGDIVLEIDGQTAEERRAFLEKITAASTPGRLNNLVDMSFLRGDKDRPCNLKVRKATGEELSVSIPRSGSQMPPRAKPTDLPVYTILPSGFGYIDLGRLMGPDAAAALEAIKNTPGAVFDMRGYPVGGANLLGAMLCRKKAARALFNFIEFDGGTGQFRIDEKYQYIEPLPNGSPGYDGKIVVLIGNSSQSAAEHTCLMLESIADVTFIGSPTSGANGNITHTVLPGRITISFTGMGVRHADGRQLQRMGVQPHIRVESTLEGILAGRDEVLEEAVSFLKKQTSSDSRQP